MPTENETNELSSKTGSGQSVMASLGQKVLSLSRGSGKSPVDNMTVGFGGSVVFYRDGTEDKTEGWFIYDTFGLPYAGPYKRKQDAKGQLTRLRKGYTPAARKV